MQEQDNIRKDILEGTIEVFNEKGLKFTMDDLARKIGKSKKTIYTVYREKDELFLAMVDYIFDSIKASEQAVLEDKSLDTLGKIEAIMGVMPESYNAVDFRELYTLKERYPKIYAQVQNRLETGWETTISLIEQGIKEGVVRSDVSIPIIKMMLEASLEQFFQRDVLIENGITYSDGLNQVVSIIIDGIRGGESR